MRIILLDPPSIISGTSGGLFTVLIASGTIIFLFTKPPLARKKRVCLLMTAAFFIGASVGLLTKYLFGIDQGFVISILAGTTTGLWHFLSEIPVNKGQEPVSLLVVCDLFDPFGLPLLLTSLVATVLAGWYGHWPVLACYMGYIVVYSKEVMYDARFGDLY